VRVYILYSTVTLLIVCILVQNVVDLKFLQNYLPVFIIGVESVLSLITGYYLIQSIRNEGG